MKFITEEDLRNLFRKEPFTTYEIKAGERLTPGGRQFLLDRRVNIIEYSHRIKKETDRKKQSIEIKQKDKDYFKNDLKKKLFDTRMKSMEALFLLTAEDILNRDVVLAQNVINLGKEFSNIKNHLNKDTGETSCYKECTGIKRDNIYRDLDDCFEITEFHIQLENGRNIIMLHRLRCALRELEPFILEIFENNDSEFCRRVIGKVNQSINTLSQMICSNFGGKKCQRES